jgi:glutaredoxin
MHIKTRLHWLLLFLPLLANADIYTWTDEQGHVHFGDAPKEEDNATSLELKINSYEAVTYDPLPDSQANKQDNVVMYATSWCGYCKQARNYFRSHGIAYVEYDIEKDRQAKLRYDRLGATGIPVILFGKHRMNGFSASRFQRLYQQ